MSTPISIRHSRSLPSPLAQRIADAFKLDPQPTFRVAPGKSATTQSPRGKPSLLERLDAWFWRQEQKDLHDWLAQSGDLFELERRIRDRGRGVGMRYW